MGANNDDSPLRLVLLIIINGYWLNHQHAVVVVVVLTIILLLIIIIVIIVIRSPFSTHLAYLSSTNPLSELTLLSGDAMVTIYGGATMQIQNQRS